MSERRWELVASDKSTVFVEPPLDAIVVEDSQSDGRFPDPPWTDESGWSELFRKTEYLLDQLVASEADPWWRGRGLSEYARWECEGVGSLGSWNRWFGLSLGDVSSNSVINGHK